MNNRKVEAVQVKMQKTERKESVNSHFEYKQKNVFQTSLKHERNQLTVQGRMCSKFYKEHT